MWNTYNILVTKPEENIWDPRNSKLGYVLDSSSYGQVHWWAVINTV